MNAQARIECQLTAILGTSNGEASVLAGANTLLSCKSLSINVHRVRESAAKVLVVVDIASFSLVIIDRDLLRCLGVGWVLPEGESTRTTTGLRVIAVARQVALGVISLLAIYGVAAVADSIVSETGIAECIAC